jgi:hypothetical protein
MTQSIYHDIVVNNPYIDNILSWNKDTVNDYEVVYNPHGDKILPGGWNNMDTKLYDMYPYFCRVKPDKMFIDPKPPSEEILGLLPNKFIVVHTTGGSIEYRTYSHMGMVIKKLPYPVVQIGGRMDRTCNGAIDLRGKLSWRETAYIMGHSQGAIVIDSFPSHLAGLIGIPLVVLFGPAPARVTGPKGDPNLMIFLEPNKLEVCPITSNCWGVTEKNKCVTPCIDSISPFLVAQSLNKLIGENK